MDSLRSEKMEIMRGMRSCVGSGQLINFFQAGGSLHTEGQSGQQTDNHQNEQETDSTGRTCKTSVTSGRE